MKQKNIGTEKALQKIRHYCAYQERSHQEVKDKLYSYGLYKEEVESILSRLIEENYLNEERFAIAFAGGKFRVNQWGRVKIKYALKQKRISEYCIRVGLASLDQMDYEKTLQKLFDAKLETLREERSSPTKKQKLQSYLMQKGFEPALISVLLNKM